MSPLSPLPPSLRRTLSISCAALGIWALIGAPACSKAAGSSDTPLIIQVSAEEITVENRTGRPLVRGEVSIIPPGTRDSTPHPFTMLLPGLPAGEKVSFRLTSFKSPEGIRFIGDAAVGRSVTVTAKDADGRLYAHEVPFK